MMPAHYERRVPRIEGICSTTKTAEFLKPLGNTRSVTGARCASSCTAFREPAFFITPKEVVGLPTIETVEHTYARVTADMPPDYVRTEFSPLSVHRLNDDLTMVSGSGAWKNAANDDLIPSG